MQKDVEILLLDPLEGGQDVSVTLHGNPEGVSLKTLESGRQILAIAKGSQGLFDVVFTHQGTNTPERKLQDLTKLTQGGPSLFPETIQVKGRQSEASAGYAVDDIPLPKDNPWASNIRFGAFDFFSDGKRAACSTWNGDVWIAEGIDGDLSEITSVSYTHLTLPTTPYV